MIIVWLNPGSWWQGQVHLEHRSSQWEHCEKDCAHVLEESQNDDANSLQSVKTFPNCRRDRRNSVSGSRHLEIPEVGISSMNNSLVLFE